MIGKSTRGFTSHLRHCWRSKERGARIRTNSRRSCRTFSTLRDGIMQKEDRMTIDEAIRHCEEVADSLRQGCDEYDEGAKGCEAEHRQLAEWLRELKELRSNAQGHENDHIAESSKKDTISRQAAIDALDGEITITGKTNAEAVRDYVHAVKGRIERIPPIQPKRGKYRAVVCDGIDLLACSECGYTGAFWSYNFCPSCGADMRGTEHGND